MSSAYDSSSVINKLSDAAVRAFTRKDERGPKLFDGGGLYLQITPGGTAVWRIKYRFAKKARIYSPGPYPGTSLEMARQEREKVKALLREGKDPVQQRRLSRAHAIAAAEKTFEAVAREWLAKQEQQWSEIHYEKSVRALERDVFPHLGKLPVSEITAPMITGVVNTILNRGVRETASKVLQHIHTVFRYAHAHGLCSANPADPVPEVLPPKPLTRRMPAVLDWAGLGEILRKAETAHLSPSVRMAHRLCAFTAARIGNIVAAEWQEFDLEGEIATWTIPRAKMKARDRHHDHKIVLAPTIATEMRTWRAMIGTEGPVFPSPQHGKHISREALEKAYRVTLGLANRHSPHGWRAALTTLAKDEGFAADVVELALDHVHANEVVRAYDRGERLQDRIRLMTWWAEQLRSAQIAPRNVVESPRADYRVIPLAARLHFVMRDGGDHRLAA